MNCSGWKKKAKVLAEYCEDVYSNTNDIMGKVGDDKVDLVYCNGTDGLNVIAQGSFHAEIINLVSNNVAVAEDISSKGAGNPVDMEQLVLWDHDVIIFAPDGIYDTVADDPAWRNLLQLKMVIIMKCPWAPTTGWAFLLQSTAIWV